MKSILITGSNRGLGYATIEELLRKKSQYHLILSARDDDSGIKAFTTLSEKYPNEASHLHYHQLDITKTESIQTFISWLKEKFGKLDYLINNAGVGIDGEVTIEKVNKTFEVNVEGTIDFTEKILKENLINKGGKIIVLGSIAGLLNRIKTKISEMNLEMRRH